METPTNTQPVVPTDTPTASEAPAPDVPIQVDKSVFLAARLREMIAEAANLRSLVAELQKENATLRAQVAQAEIDKLDQEYDVGNGTILQARQDGTYWRVPRSALQRSQG